jgi:hypothetical protein
MLILFGVRLSNEKIRQSAALPALQGSEELTADLLTNQMYSTVQSETYSDAGLSTGTALGVI